MARVATVTQSTMDKYLSTGSNDSNDFGREEDASLKTPLTISHSTLLQVRQKSLIAKGPCKNACASETLNDENSVVFLLALAWASSERSSDVSSVRGIFCFLFSLARHLPSVCSMSVAFVLLLNGASCFKLLVLGADLTPHVCMLCPAAFVCSRTVHEE